MGKGSKQRPTNKPQFDSNFDDIDWKKTENQTTNVIPAKNSKLGKFAKRFVYT